MAKHEENKNNPDYRKNDLSWRHWALATYVGAMIAIGVAIELGNSDEEKSTPVDPIVEKYNADKMPRKDDKLAFDFLSNMSPRQALSMMIEDGRQDFGEDLQYNLYLASQGLRPVNGGSGTETNQYDLAHNLIPKNTQAALHDVGVYFNPVEPVSYWGPAYPYCAANDYTNHTREDFEVKAYKADNGTILEIPLGTEQKAYEDPVNIRDILYISRVNQPGYSRYIEAEQTPELIAACSTPDPDPNYRTISLW